MVRLVLILLGVEYLRKRWAGIMAIGSLGVAVGLFVLVDALEGVQYFPLHLFGYFLVFEGLATLAAGWAGVGGQRILRYVKGLAFIGAALLLMAEHHHGNFVLSMIIGTVFMVEGLLQSATAVVVRYRRWRAALTGGMVEICIAIFFYQPYPTHYVGTIPYCLGLALVFGGWNMVMVALRVRALTRNPAFDAADDAVLSADVPAGAEFIDAVRLDQGFVRDGPPRSDEKALTVHVWTPVGSSKAPAQRQLLIDRYIAAVDINGVISTGHAALESPEGVYISLYPGVEIDRSPNEFARILRATRENDIPGVFQADYPSEAKAWCESTVKVRIRNYDPLRLRAFWDAYRRDTTYNLTYRNCSSTVSRALEAAIEGSVGHFRGCDRGWGAFLRILITPELWVAAQVRKRAATMAWTPGLTLDYARALSMLVDPRPYSWVTMARMAVRRMYRSRQRWQREQESGSSMPK